MESYIIEAFYILLKGIFAGEEFRSVFDEIDVAGQRRFLFP